MGKKIIGKCFSSVFAKLILLSKPRGDKNEETFENISTSNVSLFPLKEK
jgi:hypothetical protein